MEIKNLFKLLLPRLEQYLSSHNMNQLCTFVGVSPTSVADWLRGRQEATGERLIRLWHFLAAAGCESPELESLPAFNRYTSTLFGYSLITLEEACEAFGVVNPQSALKGLRGQPVMRARFSYEELYEMYDERLQEAKSNLTVALGGSGPGDKNPGPGPSSQPRLQDTIPASIPGQYVLATEEPGVLLLATLLSSALPLARHINSDQSTPEERSRLRELMGEGGVFELSNILNALCSERARTQMKGVSQ